MYPTTTNRLEDIADRQRTSRVMDVLFAGMIALLMAFFIVSFGQANAKSSHRSTTPAAQAESVPAIAHAAGTCLPDVC